MLDEREEYAIGRVFTPVEWAMWLIDRFKVYEAWRCGARVFDPTCGRGAFFTALMMIARKRNERAGDEDLGRLTGIEINPGDRLEFLHSFKLNFGIDFPEDNFVTGNFLDYRGERKFDIAIGNPPWANFTDLPEDFREKSKRHYIKYGLVVNRKDVLLGGSRTDISSLIIQKCMINHVGPQGCGYFYVPLSLFFNGNANRNFRPRAGQNSVFAVDEIIDFKGAAVFNGVSTRYGAVALRSGKQQPQFVPLLKPSGNRSIYCRVSVDGDAWSMSRNTDGESAKAQVRVRSSQKPRQGMNTGGLNKAFILERVTDTTDNLLEKEIFINGFGEEVEISTNYVFPLMGSHLFGGQPAKRRRYILCLHHREGQALDEQRIHELYGVRDYLENHRAEMEGRKGVLMRARMSKGRYWSLIGVGPYSFTRYKVAWESLGRRTFKAVVLEGCWQGNQAMHAYIPSESRDDAERICEELNRNVPAFLKSFGMEGTCNWAQPGRIKSMLVQKHQSA
ncbi:MAG: hypothetical protein GDA39_07685 [Hyphomonadaceae bacterium]|nr:hypothetical protein [Hyphomonadaceae bacterium]MBC6412751.1 hypothetical protein [Hyphomonadaceae bacterium]